MILKTPEQVRQAGNGHDLINLFSTARRTRSGLLLCTPGLMPLALRPPSGDL